MNILRSVTFIGGLLLAVGAFVAYLALGGVLNPPPYEVVVAIRDIPPYTTITSDMLAKDSQTMSQTVVKTLVLAQELDQYLGGMAIEHIQAGEPLRKSAIVAPDNPAAARRLSLALDDPTKVAMVLPVTLDTCPQQTASGDYVNLVVSFAAGTIREQGGQTLAEMLAPRTPAGLIAPATPFPTPTAIVTPVTPTISALSAEEMVLPITKIIIHKCKVLAVHRAQVINPAYGIGTGQEAQPYIKGDAEALIVLVPEDSAELLSFAVDNGKVHVALLPAMAGQDEEYLPTFGVAWSDVLAWMMEERRRAIGEIVEVAVPPTETPTPEGWLPPEETPTLVPHTPTPQPTPTETAAVPITSLAGMWRTLACLLVPVLAGLVFVVFMVRVVKRRKAA